VKGGRRRQRVEPRGEVRRVHDGEDLRDEMRRYFAGKPLAYRVRVVDVRLERDGAAVVIAVVVYGDGAERRVSVAVRKCDPAWLVDWPATRELAQ